MIGANGLIEFITKKGDDSSIEFKSSLMAYDGKVT
jgi:hypothetical protein